MPTKSCIENKFSTGILLSIGDKTLNQFLNEEKAFKTKPHLISFCLRRRRQSVKLVNTLIAPIADMKPSRPGHMTHTILQTGKKESLSVYNRL